MGGLSYFTRSSALPMIPFAANTANSANTANTDDDMIMKLSSEKSSAQLSPKRQGISPSTGDSRYVPSPSIGYVVVAKPKQTYAYMAALPMMFLTE